MTIIHTPVLLNETLELLDVSNLNNAWMIDATAGEGGHSEAFLSRFPNLRLTAVDADESILESARQRLAPFGGRVNFHRGWSEDFFKSIEDTGGQKPVRILIDLGVSLFHYEQGGRGFSFRKDEPLDMRIDKAGTDAPTAAELVATLREDELAALLWRNAEERYSRRIASSIVKARRYAAIETSSALAAIVASAVPRGGGKPDMKNSQGRGFFSHPATKTFQALRIAVNGELERLESRLEAAFAALAPGGRIGVISFHSLEDRIVKNFFRDRAKPAEAANMPPSCKPKLPIKRRGCCRIVTKKPVTAGSAERQSHPPSRSAKLRVAEKTGG